MVALSKRDHIVRMPSGALVLVTASVLILSFLYAKAQSPTSCLKTAGAKQAEMYVKQCEIVKTDQLRAPCDAQNPCPTLTDYIGWGCHGIEDNLSENPDLAQRGVYIPNFCYAYLKKKQN
jgi:hypothetical protein